MLKIKEDKMQELKSLGFKPKYDSDTGEILFYYKDYFTDKLHTSSGTEYKHYQIRITKEEIKIENGTWLKKKQIKTNFVYDKPPIYTDGFGMFIDLIYDLIKADMVEKDGE